MNGIRNARLRLHPARKANGGTLRKRCAGTAVGALLALGAAQAGADADWRDTASQEEKVQKLVEVMPSTANIMIEMGERYSHLYWAAKLGQWEFATYQAEEIEGLLETLQITRPGRAESTAVFLERVYPDIEEAAKAEDWERFSRAFAAMHEQCMACHVAEDHAFIVLPSVPPRSQSPVLHGLEEERR
jgi:hypothetical protein